MTTMQFTSGSELMSFERITSSPQLDPVLETVAQEVDIIVEKLYNAGKIKGKYLSYLKIILTGTV